MPRRLHEFGPFRLDPAGRILFRRNEAVALPPKAADALVLLVENAGSVVEKDELLTKLWPDTAVEEGSLTRTISVLRKALGEREEGPEYIATIPKRGYRFVADVRVVDQDAIADGPRTPAPQLRKRRLAIAAAIAVLAVAGMAYGGWRVMHRVRPVQRRLIMAVLPVQNLSGDERREYIADGLTEEIIAQLSRYNPEKLGVIARTSSMAYRISGKTVQQIGRELGADYVVESSLRADGERLRVTAELVRVQDQTHVWSSSYDRTTSNLFTLEDEVAQSIAISVGVELQTAARSRLAASKPVNSNAYLAYLEGRYYWNRRSPASLERAIADFQKATQLDPSYALAWDGLADAYASQCLIADVPPLDVFPKAKEAVLTAIRLDNGLAEAHTTLAYLKFWFDFDWTGAEAEFRRALDLNPGYATAHQWYAEFLRLMGREEEAIAEGHKALELDPVSLIINMEMGLPYYLQKRFDEANRYYLKTLDMDPNFGLAHCVLGWSYQSAGAYESAIAELEKAHLLDDSSAVLASLGRAYAEAGRPREAEKIVAQLKERAKSRYVSPVLPALVHIGLHQNRQALDELDQAYRQHDWVLPWVHAGLMFAPLHSEPRYQDLLRRLNFPAGFST